MAKISVIGICGSSHFMSVDHFHKKGETLSASSLYEEYGGKGMNQAVSASRMGAEVSFLAAVGDDINACRNALVENNIRPFLIKKNGASARAFILTDKTSENQVTVYKGVELCPDDVISFEGEISQSDILLLQNEVPQEVNLKAIELSKKHNIPVILNPAPAREIPSEISDYVFLVTPNEQEAQFIDVSRFKNCIITKGSRGCEVLGKGVIPPKKVAAVDTTGAGDTFNGILAVLLAEGIDILKAAEIANVGAALSVTKKYVLPSIPTREQIEKECGL